MFEINSEKANITDEHVVTILRMSIFSASVHLAKVYLKSGRLAIDNPLNESLAKEEDDYLMQEI